MGLRLVCTATCMDGECDWTSVGQGGQVDRDAGRHSKATGHATNMSCQPVKE